MASKHPSRSDPKLRRHPKGKGKGRAFVELSGQRHYLGAWGDPRSLELYHAKLTEWHANGRRPLRGPDPDAITVVELIDQAIARADRHYRRPDGTPTGEAVNMRLALRPLRRLYGPTPAAQFGPGRLKAVRQAMIEAGWARSNVNAQVGRIRRAFKWAVEEERIEPAVLIGLQAVAPLSRGRTDARETARVHPVQQHAVDATLPHVAPIVADMIRVQLLTGMRPGELCIMRPVDVDRRGPVWIYRPTQHKTLHHDRDRQVCIGPAAQSILAPYFADRALDAFMFSPAEADAQVRARRHAARITPMSCGNRPGSNVRRSPRRKPGDRYTPTTYARAIRRGCELAWPPPPELARQFVAGARGRQRLEPRSQWRRRLGVRVSELKEWNAAHRWTPHQLRHTAGTRARQQGSIEDARTMLGHAHMAATEIYAEQDVAKAAAIAMKIG